MSETNGSVEVTLHVDNSACGQPESRPLRRPGLHLTDAEREAVEWCIFQQATPQRIAVTLRGVLERLG